jgi:hypothetical protein
MLRYGKNIAGGTLPAGGATDTLQGPALFPTGVMFREVWSADQFKTLTDKANATSLIVSLNNPGNVVAFNNNNLPATLTTLGLVPTAVPLDRQGILYTNIWGGNILRGNSNPTGGAFHIGALYRVRATGVITTTGTPSLTATLGLLDQTLSSTFTAVSTTGAVAIGAVTANNIDFEFFLQVQNNNATVQVGSWGKITLSVNGTADNAIIAPYTETTIAIANDQAIDLRFTSSVTTTFTLKGAIIEAIC